MKPNKILKFFAALTALALALPVAGTRVSAADSASKAGIVKTASTSLNVRALASTSAKVVTKLNKGAYVTLISKSGSFWKVEYGNGLYGYAHGDYIGTVSSSPAVVNVSSGNLNVRAGAGTSHAVKDRLPKGTVVLKLSDSGDFSKILYHGTKTGYVAKQYLKAASGSSGSTAAAKMLWPVPDSTRVTQEFKAGTHLGIDIGAKVPKQEGDTVVAALSGTVVFAGSLSGYGNVIYVNSVYNGKNLQLRYAHLRSLGSVKAGQKVTAGAPLALMGNTGTSSGAHLHFEVRVRKLSGDCIANSESTAVDPRGYLPKV